MNFLLPKAANRVTTEPNTTFLPDHTQTIMAARSKEQIIHHILDELIGKGNADVIEDTFSADYVAHAGGKKFEGHAFLKRFSRQLSAAITDIEIVDVQFFLQDDCSISWLRTLRGTNESNLQGIPASGKKITWREMVVTRFENDKIAEEWIVSELMGELLLNAPKR